MLSARPIVTRLLQQSGTLDVSGAELVLKDRYTASTYAETSPVYLSILVRRYHGEGHVKPPSMDELPVPTGSWQARYDANQRKYNAALLIGIAFTTATLIVAKTSGLVYLNYSPPKSLD